MSNNKQKASWWIVVAFMIVPLVTSLVSTIHVVSFFELSNYAALAVILAVAFELGALSSLAGLVAMDKINKNTVWMIFVLLTAFQMMGNTYYAYDTTTTKMISNSNLIKNFTELFGFSIYDNNDIIFVKRIIAIFSGAILPVISLCFLHLLMSYVIKSSKIEIEPAVAGPDVEPVKEVEKEDFTLLGKEALEQINEPVVLPVKPNSQEEDFVEHLKLKKEKLEKDRINYVELLKVLYNNGAAQKGEELPAFNEFVKMVNTNQYSTDTIKTFLTLCNYLDISKVSKDQKIALKSYEEAKIALEGYLTLNIE
jgi:hypothetical protein